MPVVIKVLICLFVIGGTHLGFMGQGEQLDRSLQALDDYQVEMVHFHFATDR